MNEKVRKRFSELSTGVISDALDRLGIRGGPSTVFPIVIGVKMVGPAVTLRQVVSKTSEKLIRHTEVLDNIAEKGDVIVIDAGGRKDVATWGGILTLRARMKGIAGVVIDGATRDVKEIKELGLPVFAVASIPVGSTMRYETVSINEPIQCGGVVVRPGDAIIGDDDGVINVPQNKVEETLEIAERFAEVEKKWVEALKKGVSFAEAARKYPKI